MKEMKIDLAGKCCRKIIRFKVPKVLRILAFAIFIFDYLLEFPIISVLASRGGPLGNDNTTLGLLCICIELGLLVLTPILIFYYSRWNECKCCEDVLSPDYNKGLKAIKVFVIIAVPIYLSLFLRIIYFLVNRENRSVLILFVMVITKFVGCFPYTILPILRLINYIVIYIFIRNGAWAFAWSIVLRLSFNPHLPVTNASCYFCHSTIPGKILCFSRKRAFHVECARYYFVHEQNIEDILRFMGISTWTTSGSIIKIYAEHVSANLIIKAHGRFKAVSGTILHFNEKDQLEIVDTTTNETITNILYGRTLISHLLSPNGQNVPSYNFVIRGVTYHSQGNRKALSKYNQNQRKSYKLPLTAPVFVVEDRYFIKMHKEEDGVSFKIYDIYDEECGVESIRVPREYRDDVYTTEKLRVVKPGFVQVTKEIMLDINKRRVIVPVSHQDVNIIIIP